VDIPLRVMLRASDGFAAGNAAALRAEGADEFVLGFLAADGLADLAAIGAGAGLDESRWTFHRAVDRAVDRDALRSSSRISPGWTRT
jgi:copper homeostasis protein